MIKAIFMDYYGTVAYENGPIALEVVKNIFKNSKAESMEAVFGYWWKTYREKLMYANGENFRTQHDVALDTFKVLLAHFQSSCDPEKALERMEEHWCTTAVYEDARQFLNEVGLPVYFVTNSDDKYVYGSVKKNGLHPVGIITSEQARYSKPRKEIFLYALEKTGFKPEEIIHVGDSVQGDVLCPESIGITAVLLNREGESVPEGVKSVDCFIEVLEFIKQRNLEEL